MVLQRYNSAFSTIVMLLVSMYRNSLFSKPINIATKLKRSEVPLLKRGKLITYVSTTSFMYELRSRSLISKLAETLLRGKEKWSLGEGSVTVRDNISKQAGRGRKGEIIAAHLRI